MSKFFRKRQKLRSGERKYLKSATDLRLLPEQVIYVEGYNDRKLNNFIRKRYDELVLSFKNAEFSTNFLYLPVVAEQLQYPELSLSGLLNYYFPNIEEERGVAALSVLFSTERLSRLLFSWLGDHEVIDPGFFRYVGREQEGLFVYEYTPLSLSRKPPLLQREIDDYIKSLPGPELPGLSAGEEPVSVDMASREEKEEFLRDMELIEEALFSIHTFKEEAVDSKVLLEEKEEESAGDECKLVFLAQTEDCRKKRSPKIKEEREFPQRSMRRRGYQLLDETEDDIADDPQELQQKQTRTDACAETREQQTGHDLISQIKTDIQNLKELGFYELLLKEIGAILFEDKKDRMFCPSRLVIDEEFRIYLPDFNNMEIEMTPLPKSLFILFLRHPQGINLKTLIDYKKELLEIYKLLSYRETYFDMVESIDRICNPFEGSVNEKLSRIKEAFLKKMSMDTAKHYIVAGERGMEKKIGLDRSLLQMPESFREIGLTKKD